MHSRWCSRTWEPMGAQISFYLQIWVSDESIMTPNLGCTYNLFLSFCWDWILLHEILSYKGSCEKKGMKDDTQKQPDFQGLRVYDGSDSEGPGYLDNYFGKSTTALLFKAPGFYLHWLVLSLAPFSHPQIQWGTFIGHGVLHSHGKLLRHQPGASPYQGHLIMLHLSSPLPLSIE